MSMHSLMVEFHNAILNRDKNAFAAKVLPNDRLAAEARMNIYIEGYRLRLCEAIKADYPATMALLGNAFDALAQAFIESTPPSHFSLDHYPYAFADYVRDHGNDTFAADLAALECAIAETFLLEESEALSPQMLMNVTPEAFGDMTLELRTASRLLAAGYPVDGYLISQRKDEMPERPAASDAYMMVLRHENEVKRHHLTRAEFLVMEQLNNGLAVGAALEHVAEAEPELLPDIAAGVQVWFGRWTQNGFFKQP